MPNTERLLDLGRWAIAEDAKRQAGLPSEWDQESWFRKTSCGTAACMAGKVVLDDGGVPSINDSGYGWLATMPDGRRMWADDYATEALDLPDDDGDEDHLFAGENSLDDVLRIIADLTGVDLRYES